MTCMQDFQEIPERERSQGFCVSLCVCVFACTAAVKKKGSVDIFGESGHFSRFSLVTPFKEQFEGKDLFIGVKVPECIICRYLFFIPDSSWTDLLPS